MKEYRFVSLMDGTGMDGMVIVFKTNAPIEELKELERISCDCYINGNEEEVPIWKYVLEEKGFVFNYVDEHGNVTPYGTSTTWLEDKYPEITEHYCIENQP